MADFDLTPDINLSKIKKKVDDFEAIWEQGLKKLENRLDGAISAGVEKGINKTRTKTHKAPEEISRQLSLVGIRRALSDIPSSTTSPQALEAREFLKVQSKVLLDKSLKVDKSILIDTARQVRDVLRRYDEQLAIRFLEDAKGTAKQILADKSGKAQTLTGRRHITSGTDFQSLQNLISSGQSRSDVLRMASSQSGIKSGTLDQQLRRLVTSGKIQVQTAQLQAQNVIIGSSAGGAVGGGGGGGKVPPNLRPTQTGGGEPDPDKETQKYWKVANRSNRAFARALEEQASANTRVLHLREKMAAREIRDLSRREQLEAKVANRELQRLNRVVGQAQARNQVEAISRNRRFDRLSSRGISGAGVASESIEQTTKAIKGNNIQLMANAEFLRKQQKEQVASSQTAGELQRQIGLTTRRMVLWAGVTGALFAAQNAFRRMVGTIIDVDAAIHRLSRLLPISSQGIEEMGSSAAKTAVMLGADIGQVIDSMSKFAQSFKDQATVTKLANDALLLNNISIGGLDSATENLIATMKQFNMTSSESGKIIDSWAAVSANAKVTADDLGDAAATAGQAALNAGIKFDKFNGIVAAVAQSTNASGKEIGAAFRTIFERMVRPESAKGLQKLGIMPFGKGGEARPFLDTIADIQIRIKEFADKQTVLVNAGKKTRQEADRSTEAFRQEIATLAAGPRRAAIFSAMLVSMGEAGELARISQKSFGEAAAQNAVIMESLGMKLKQAKGGFQQIAVAAGEGGLKGAMGGLLDVLNNVLGLFTQLPTKAQAVITSLAGIATSIAALQFLQGSLLSPGVAGSKTSAFAGLGNLSQARGNLGASKALRIPKQTAMAMNPAAAKAMQAEAEVASASVGVFTKLALILETVAMRTLGVGVAVTKLGTLLNTVLGASVIGAIITAFIALTQIIKEIASDSIEKLHKGFKILGFTIREGTDEIEDRINKNKELIQSTKDLTAELEKQGKTPTPKLFSDILTRYTQNIDRLKEQLEKTPQNKSLQKTLEDAVFGKNISLGTNGLNASLKNILGGATSAISDLAIEQSNIGMGMALSNFGGQGTTLSVKEMGNAVRETAESFNFLNDATDKARKVAIDQYVADVDKRILDLNKNMKEAPPGFLDVFETDKIKKNISGLEFIKKLLLAMREISDGPKTKGENKGFGDGAGKIRLAKDAISELEKSLASTALTEKNFGLETDVLGRVTDAYKSGLDSLIQKQVEFELQIRQGSDAMEDAEGSGKKLENAQEKLDKTNRNLADGIKDIKMALPTLIKEYEALRAVQAPLQLTRDVAKEELSNFAQTLETRRQGEHDIAQERINLNAEIAQELEKMNRAQQANDASAVKQAQFRVAQLRQSLDALDARSKKLQAETSILGKIGKGITTGALKGAIGSATDTGFNALGNILSSTLSPTFAAIKGAILPQDKMLTAAESTADNTKKIYELFLLLRDSSGSPLMQVAGVSSSMSSNLTTDANGRLVPNLSKLTEENIAENAGLDEAATKLTTAADILKIAGTALQGAAIGAGITQALGKKGMGGFIGGAIGGGVAATVAKNLPVVGPIVQLIGGFIGSLFDKKVKEDFIQPLIPPLDDNTKAVEDNTSAMRIQTMSIEKIINAPSNFSIPPAAIKGGFIPSAQMGGHVLAGGLVNVHKGERIVPASQVKNLGGVNINISGGSGSPSEIAEEVMRQIETVFSGQSRSTGLASGRI